MISRLINQRYEVLERVGEGAFFQVYKARDKVMGRIVAVKTLQSAYALDADFCQALRKSAAAVTGLAHPNIARLYEAGEEEGAPFLVTEFVRGINLKERIRRIAPFTLAVAVDFAIAIAEALQHAHGESIVHGDLRPHNVVISPEGAVKVTDFGLAPALAASQQAMAGNLGRAVHYQAPEIAAGKPASFSSDLYALGVILFEMLTGGLPYPGETPVVTAMKHQNEPVPSPRSLNPGVPRSVEGIVMKALQKRPEDRYRAAADMLNDLKSVRDALRFGKPLSWSPLEGEPAPIAEEGEKGRKGERETFTPSPLLPFSPSAPEPAGAALMSARVVPDDRVSLWLKLALGIVLFVILGGGIVMTAVWMATFAKPPELKFPNLVGMKWDDAQKAADRVGARLMRHDEFKDGYDPEVIFRSDWEPGRSVRPGRSVNVWVSKGSRMVWVPDVTKVPADEAENKLKTAGLTLGSVNRENNDKIPFGAVIAQNPRAGKRINRDEQVHLTVSDGPKIVEPPPTPPTETDTTDQPPGDTGTPGETGDPGTGANTPTEELTPRTFNLNIQVKRDGLGRRRVKVEYDDSQGTHTPIDEFHDEREQIIQKVDVYGAKITLRVYYGDDPKLVSEKTFPLRRRR